MVKVFIDNPFIVPMVKHSGGAVRSLDLSMERDKVAVVDVHNAISVYDVATGQMIFEEQNAEAVAWNTEIPDMLCFSAHGTLSIKTGNFPIHQQRMPGVVVGFKGSRIYALHYVSLNAIDVPQSASLYRYLEKRDFAAAYKIACLGVTEPDWQQLAHEALKALNLDIAKRAYMRLRDTKYIDLVSRIEAERRQAGHDDTILIGTVLAYQGKFQEAAKLFCKANRVEKAIDMFSDLRKWEEARQFAHTASADAAADLVRRQAAWAEESNDMSTAYQTYLAAGEHMKAIKIVGEKGWVDKLHEISKTLDPKSQAAELRACVGYLDQIAKEEAAAAAAPPPSISLGAALKVGGFMNKLKKKAGIQLPVAAGHAKEILNKLGDTDGLLQQYLDYNQWDEALKLIEEHPALASRFTCRTLSGSSGRIGSRRRRPRSSRRDRRPNRSRCCAHSRTTPCSSIATTTPATTCGRSPRRCSRLRPSGRRRRRSRSSTAAAALRSSTTPTTPSTSTRTSLSPRSRPIRSSTLRAPLATAARRRAVWRLEGLLPLRAREAGQGPRRQQAGPDGARAAADLQGADRVAGAGRPFCTDHSCAAYLRRGGAAALVLPLPDDQPAPQSSGRQVHRMRPPLLPLLCQLRAAPPRAFPARARHCPRRGDRAAAARAAAAQAQAAERAEPTRGNRTGPTCRRSHSRATPRPPSSPT